MYSDYHALQLSEFGTICNIKPAIPLEVRHGCRVLGYLHATQDHRKSQIICWKVLFPF